MHCMNKTALITGATSGIGAAFARQLAAEGYSLILHGRREEKLKKLMSELSAFTDVQLVLGDLREQSTVDRLIELGRSRKIGLLINNAGYGSGKDFFVDDADNQLGMLTVHCHVPMILCRELIPEMVKAGGGQVINVSSIAGEQRLPGAVMYSSSKSLLTVFSEALALKVQDQGVSVQALLPGFTFSDFHDRIPEWTREKRNRGIVRWQRSEDVVAFSLKMIRRRRPRIVVISGFSNRLITTLTRLIGKRLYRFVMKKMQAKISKSTGL